MNARTVPSVLALAFFPLAFASGCSIDGRVLHPTEGDAMADLSMMSDFEDGSALVFPYEGRRGSWYFSNDGSGVQVPPSGRSNLVEEIVPPRGTSHFGLHTSGHGFTGYAGAGNNNGTYYDVSKYKGISFWARLGSDVPRMVHLGVSGRDTDVNGGVCDPSPTATVDHCFDSFGKQWPMTLDWVKYEVGFADLAQAGWGKQIPTGFNSREMSGVGFVGDPGLFDFWIDDIGFYK